MSSETQELEQLPRMQRHQLRRGKLVKVMVERSSGTPPQEAEAELLDISRSGMKLSVPMDLAIHEALLLKLEIPDLGTRLSLPATACWSRPGKGEKWRLGCQFSPPLPEGTLAKLAEGGFLQRRENLREEVTVDAGIRWETAEESISARITDVSTGGFCTLCYHPGVVGGRLLLEVTDGDGRRVQIPARARWQREVEKGALTGQSLFFTGCMFLDNQGYRALRSIVDPLEADRPGETPESRWRRTVWWAALAAVGVIGGVLYLLLR